jgi:hypothetical protein
MPGLAGATLENQELRHVTTARAPTPESSAVTPPHLTYARPRREILERPAAMALTHTDTIAADITTHRRIQQPPCEINGCLVAHRSIS